MATSRSGLAAAVLGGRLYVVGGWDGQVSTLQAPPPCSEEAQKWRGVQPGHQQMVQSSRHDLSKVAFLPWIPSLLCQVKLQPGGAGRQAGGCRRLRSPHHCPGSRGSALCSRDMLTQVEVLEPELGVWVPRAPLPHPCSGLAGVVVSPQGLGRWVGQEEEQEEEKEQEDISVKGEDEEEEMSSSGGGVMYAV